MTLSGPADIASQALSLQQDALRERLSIAMLKQRHEAEATLIDMIDRTLRATPAPGTGQNVDISA